MKSIFKAFFTVAVLAAVTTISSCVKDECADVVCQNGGTCVSGNCDCTAGYEGTLCETQERAKFIGTYTATDNPGSLVYSVSIGNGTNITAVVISSDFSDDYFVNSINATVSGKTITIARQEPDNDDYFVEGTGTFNTSTNTITWTYKIIDGTTTPEQSIDYTASWVKL